MLLPEAFRSLSRLSSALSAKASTLRSLQLNQNDSPRRAAAVPPTSIALDALVLGLFINAFAFTSLFLPHNLLYGLGCLDILILNIQFIFIQYAVFKVRMQNRMFGLVLEARFHKQV